MKYLIKFFESFGNSEIKEELQKFCNENLAYLLDEGFEVRIIWTPNCDAWRIKFNKIKADLPHLRNVERASSFYWRDIKDEVCGSFNKDWIPSYQKDMSDELIVDFETPMFLDNHTHFFYDRKQLLSGKTTNNKLSNIAIYVKLK